MIPNDSKTSKLPDFDVTDLFPCFTILTSNDERTIDVAVEKLKLFLLSQKISIKDLTLKFNKARQAAITTEMLEIVGGAEALKG